MIMSINPIQDQPFWGCSWMKGGGEGGGVGVGKKASYLKSVTRIIQSWNLAQLYLT